jgi:tRNA dimethylallyltransferase
VLAIVGPTAAGKSAVAHAVARELGGEIVVADPFQRYRGLEVAADAPSAAQRAEVPYHLVGDLDLVQSSSAGAYARLAHHAIDSTVASGRVPVVTGGTGLYLRAALADLAFPAVGGSDLRAWAEGRAADPVEGRAELARLDPAAAARVDARNPRRLARALEVARVGQAGGDALWSARTRRPTLIVGLSRPREVLDALIAARVRREIEDGLVAELRAALRAGASRAAGQIIGMREVAALGSGDLVPDRLEEALCARTRRLARKQLTWLRKTPGVEVVELGDRPADAAVPEILERWRSRVRAADGDRRRGVSPD